MNIIVEEEYGYKYYMWKSPFSNNQDLINWWNEINPNTIYEIVFPSGRDTGPDLYQSAFGGRWSLRDVEDIHGQGLNWMHIHCVAKTPRQQNNLMSMKRHETTLWSRQI